MAQAALYDRQFSTVNRQQPSCVPMPDTAQMSASSVQLSEMPHNMRGKGHKEKPQKFSRLELMKQNYEKKRQKDVEDRRNEVREHVSRKTHKIQSGGTVRAFFAERRAMEASAKGQENPAFLPPIESHFNKMKGQSQVGYSPQGSPQKIIREANTGTTYNVQGNRNNSGRNRYYRKKSMGIDKQNPLPPLRRDFSKPLKPPTPNRRYETYATLMSDEEDLETETTQAVRVHPPTSKQKLVGVQPRMVLHNKQQVHIPRPPAKQKPAALQAKITGNVHVPQHIDNVENNSDNDTWSTVTDDALPNLAKLKALREKRLSQQKINITAGTRENAKPTDFQKWQIEQDKERQERLERHQNMKQNKESEQEVISLSMRERELLERIRLEQEKLEGIKKQQQELEEQEQLEKEEEEKFQINKQMEIRQYQREDSENKMLSQNMSKEEQAESAPKKVKTVKPKPQIEIPKSEPTETQELHVPTTDFTSYYIEQAENAEHPDINLSPCSICGRKFAIDRLAKHEKVCAKNTQSKRKVFDTRKQRVAGMENAQYILSGKYKPEKKAHKVDWRVQHNNFIKAIRYAKGASSEPPPVMENPHYVQCPYCERKFDPGTADRHIPRCKDIKARPAPPKPKRK